jgi:uncharacterized surface protein with fasciclin (FAS1) repeats
MKSFYLTFAVVCTTFFFFSGCDDSVPDDRLVTFEEDQVLSYLQNDPDGRFTEFIEWLGIAEIDHLLSAYGEYTVFAPTNDAIFAYYAEKGYSGRNDIPVKDLRELTLNHIMNIKLPSTDFVEGILGSPTMSEKFLNLSFEIENGLSKIIINKVATILLLDQKVHNGYLHILGGVITVSKTSLAEVIADDGRFTLFTEALNLTKLNDTVASYIDDVYFQPQTIYSSTYSRNFYTPFFRHIGLTGFIESDSTYNANGIYTIDDLKAYAAKIYDEVYPSDRDRTDPADRRNSLNRFVAYHFMNCIIAANEIYTAEMAYYYVPGATVYFYGEMLAPNTIMEIINGNEINRRRGGKSIRFLTTNHEAMNGLYHEIDGILTYDRGMEDDVLYKRIRFDFATCWPEVITNKMRFNYTGDADRYLIPADYLTGLTFTEGTEVYHFGAQGWNNYEGDEVLLSGHYDFTARTLPIPAGSYEVRVAYAPETSRGVGQMYFDGKPCGIPLDNSLLATNPKIGWIRDSDTEDNGVENDKMMHNRGYMKGCASAIGYSRTTIHRNSNQNLRRIVGTFNFERTEPHYFRFKSVEEIVKATELDYIEFIPIPLLMSEDRW